MMKRTHYILSSIVVFLLLVATGVFVGVNSQENKSNDHEEKSSKHQQVTDREITELIDHLSSGTYAEREKATKRLIEIGKPALEELKKKSKQVTDPEALWRIDYIISRIKETKDGERSNTKERPKIRSEFHVKTSRIQTGPDGETVKIVREGKEGPVRVTIIHQKDGESVKKEYTADTVEAFREKYPEIAKKYNINERMGFSFRIKPWGLKPDEDFGKEFDRRWKHMEKQFDEWMKELEEPMRPGDLFEDLREELKRFRERLLKEHPFEFPNPKFETPEKEPGDAGLKQVDPGPVVRHHLNLSTNEGVLVQGVRENSIADRIGLKRMDVIVSVNGETVRSSSRVDHLLLRSLEQTGSVHLNVFRSGKEKSLQYSRSNRENRSKKEREKKKDY